MLFIDQKPVIFLTIRFLVYVTFNGDVVLSEVKVGRILCVGEGDTMRSKVSEHLTRVTHITAGLCIWLAAMGGDSGSCLLSIDKTGGVCNASPLEQPRSKWAFRTQEKIIGFWWRWNGSRRTNQYRIKRSHQKSNFTLRFRLYIYNINSDLQIDPFISEFYFGYALIFTDFRCRNSRGNQLVEIYFLNYLNHIWSYISGSLFLLIRP